MYVVRSPDNSPGTGGTVRKAGDWMSKFIAVRNYERACALRRAAFELLDEHVHRGVGDRDALVITSLQLAANSLGVVERSLREAAANEPVGRYAPRPPMLGAQPDPRDVQQLSLSAEAPEVEPLFRAYRASV